MKMSLNTILITGGTSGIGFALASQLIAQKNTVIITGRTEERLAKARKALPGVHTYVCDQSQPGAIRKLYEEVSQLFPNLNILINNAGIGLKRTLNDESVPLEELETEIRTNLIGPIQMVKQFLPLLKQQKNAAIVNVTSGLAFVPLGPKPIYSATKAAMHAYTMTLRVHLAHTNVKVFELAPPATATEFNLGQEDMNTPGLMAPDTFAKKAIKGLLKDKEEILPGAASILRVLGRLSPRLVLRKKLASQMSVDA